MKKSLLIILIITLGYLRVLSQSDFRPGYYITHNNDTIHGLIDYRGDIRNAKICIYKEDKNSDEKKLEPTDIFGYRFVDSKFYISKTVETKDGEEVYFLEYILNGIADLYFYRNPKDLYNHYYIEKEGKLIELTNKEVAVEVEGRGKALKRTNKHIGILKAAFADCKEVQPQIEKTDLNRKSLINVAKKYHDYVCDGEKCIIYEKKMPVVKVQVAPVISMSYNSISFTDNYKYSFLNFNKSLYPSIGLQFKINMPRFNEKISFLVNTDLNKDYFYGYSKIEESYSTTYTDLHLRTFSINISGGFNYTYPKGKIRPTFAAGCVFSKLIENDVKIQKERINSANIITTEIDKNIEMPTILYGFYLKAGCDFQLKEKLIVFSNISYRYSNGSIRHTVSVEQEEKGKINSISLSIGIYF